MEMSSSKSCIIVILLLNASLGFTNAGSLQIFGGTLTEITCSAAAPLFRLMEQDTPFNQLPDFIRIGRSPTGNSVTLYISGTNRSNNVTVICGNDVASGVSLTDEFQLLFTLMLDFVGILPAPNAVQYIEDPAGYFKVHWEPPTLVSDEFDSQNVSIDSRITHFVIYITVNESTTVYNASETSFDFENDNLSCSLSFQVAAVNPAGVGERSPLQTINWCLTQTRFVTQTQVSFVDMVREICDQSLSDWAISSTTIAVLLAVLCVILVAACSFMLLKMYHSGPGMNRDSKTTDKEIEMKENEVYGIRL